MEGTGSLAPRFRPARLVGLAVRLAYAHTHSRRFPSVVSQPLRASVILSEATAPVKLPVKHCPRARITDRVRGKVHQGWYFKGDSIPTGVGTSQSPTYPTHDAPHPNVKL